MLYKVLTYGDPRLRHKAQRVEAVTSAIRRLASDMVDTMHAANGVGLAATQVGCSLMLCVIDVPPAVDVIEENGLPQNPVVPMPLVLVNPEIVAASSETIVQNEGCLSFPEIQTPVRRAVELTVTFTDLDGTPCLYTVRHILARAVQHELDHLGGILLVDRMSPLKKISLTGQLKKLKRKTREELKSGDQPRHGDAV